MKSLLIGVLGTTLFIACSVKPAGLFSEDRIPTPPDYSNPDYWAALPFKSDPADLRPDTTLPDRQLDSPVDIFFIHPTTYTGDKGEDQWNGPVDDPGLNAKTDQTTIKYQASIFNGTGRVFAPRYRQAHLHVFYAKNQEKRYGEQAYKLAYSDVKAAFEYYLKHYNQGRPIIIAGHSQGTGHAKTLLKEYFDGKPLGRQLVAAYLVGWPVEEDFYKTIPPCDSPEQTGCFCSWRTFKEGYKPKRFWKPGNKIAVTNPLTWTTAETEAPAELNKGAIFYKFDKIHPGAVKARVFDGILWANKPKFRGSFLLVKKNYHIADYNFYYINVRENAQKRAQAFLRQNGDIPTEIITSPGASGSKGKQ